jgi:hypothetical protein
MVFPFGVRHPLQLIGHAPEYLGHILAVNQQRTRHG